MYGTQQDLSDSAHATLGYCTTDSRYEEQHSAMIEEGVEIRVGHTLGEIC